MSTHLLVLNAGSSSLKFALFEEDGAAIRERLRGQVEGLPGRPRFEADLAADGGADAGAGAPATRQRAADRRWAPDDAGAPRDVRAALGVVLRWLDENVQPLAVRAIGHRVVHGGAAHAAPVVIDDAVFGELEKLVPLAPLHEPHNLEGVRAARERFPAVPQVACFDTAFHRGHAFTEEAFALPREFYDAGVRRYGFHGLSYEHVADRLAQLSPEAGRGRVIVAHLGSGASACAIRDGRSVASTMGFTALDGLVMGTRPGQIDPGVLLWLMTERGMDAAAISDLLYKRSGLKGLSGISNDMRDLRASDAPAAREAIAVFVARLVREVGSLAAVLEGLDALVFTAGIGENDAALRAQACARLRWLGVELDEAANAAHGRGRGGLVSAPGSRVEVRVTPTDEERMIARHVQRVLAQA
jgi:acetate kinase